MNKIKTGILIILLSSILYSNDANSQQRGQQQEQVPNIPAQIKPKRLELLNKISGDSIKSEFPFQSIDDIEPFRKNALLEREIADTPLIPSDIEQVYRTINLSFEPRQEFETVDLVYGYSTTLVFLDKNGNPWDIYDFNQGDKSIFDIKERQRHILTIVPKKYAGQTNLTIMFQGAKMPASLNLKINSQKSDYITQINVNDYGNNSPEEVTYDYTGGSRVDSLSYLSQFDDKYMSQMLTNVMPDGFKEMRVLRGDEEISRNQMRVFSRGEFLYVRTKHRPFNPSEISVRVGADGETKVFKIPFISKPMFVINGQLETLFIRE